MSWRSSRTDPPANAVVAGRVRRPHGVRGEVVVEVLSSAPHRFAAGSLLWLGDQGPWLEVVSSRPGSSGASGTRSATRLVRFAGIGTPEEAGSLRGHVLAIDRSEVGPAPAGSYYPHELLGARCVDAALGDLGRIQDIVDAGGGPLLVVRSDGDGGGTGPGRPVEVLVPFVERFVRGFDREARRLDVALPAGLVEV